MGNLKILRSLVCWAYVWLACTAVSLPVDADGAQVSQSINTTLLTGDENIPSDFKLLLTIYDSDINVISFYLNSIDAIIVLSQRSCYSSTDGYHLFDLPPYMSFQASTTIYPHLINCHIIWATQRLVSIFFGSGGSGQYKEAAGQMRILQQKRAAVVGTFSLRQSNGVVDSLSSGGTSSKNETIVARQTALESRQTGSDGTGAIDSPGVDSGFGFDVEWIEGAKTLGSIKVFVSVVRALARIAVEDAAASCSAFDYEDSETEVYIGMREQSPSAGRVFYGDVSISLQKLVIAMIDKKRFAEVQVTLFKMNPRRVNYGIVTILKSRAGTTIQSVDNDDGLGTAW
ncbi:uncharacterized protein KY384_006248 [Bacidia gigantensis]|uniref:uncharacterized protein n=1 Tax=Bacidia gigantensis TaxID=2732470 RepID=UPI001D04A876|nr:uncharacterized protein KY384_006248 [Bacidia gigantensis]KAG8529611.1 hypothetical protein KY384_006248 [Bacidia gigantensis]